MQFKVINTRDVGPNGENDAHNEIKLRLNVTNCDMTQMFSSWLLSVKTKTKLCTSAYPSNP